MKRYTAKSELSTALDAIGTQCRTLSLGIIVLCWAILTGDKRPTFLGPESKLWQFEVIGGIAMACLVLDFIHSSARFESSRIFLNFLDKNKIAGDDYPLAASARYVRAGLFYAKQFMLFISSFWLVFLLGSSLIFVLPATSQTSIVGTWSNAVHRERHPLILKIKTVGIGGQVVATENELECSKGQLVEKNRIHLVCENGEIYLNGEFDDQVLTLCVYHSESQTDDAYPPTCLDASEKFVLRFRSDRTSP